MHRPWFAVAAAVLAWTGAAHAEAPPPTGAFEDVPPERVTPRPPPPAAAPPTGPAYVSTYYDPAPPRVGPESTPLSPAEPRPDSPGAPPVEPSEKRWGRQLQILGVLGLGTPVGFYGANLEFAPTSSVLLGGGIGQGAYGPQYEGHAELRFPVRKVAFGVQGGVSRGLFREFRLFDEHSEDNPLELTTWINSAFVFEAMTSSGIIGRSFVGLGVADGRGAILTVGIAAGFAFALGD